MLAALLKLWLAQSKASKGGQHSPARERCFTEVLDQFLSGRQPVNRRPLYKRNPELICGRDSNEK